MAIISGVTVNWRLSPRVITIPSPITEITVEDLQDTLLALEDDEEGMLWPHLRNTSGGEDLGGGTSVGWTMELQNAQIAFEARTANVSVGTVTTPDTGTKLIDSAATFITDGVQPGASVINITDRSVGTVISVDSETQLTHYPLADGTENDWDSSDSYKVWNEIQCEVSGGNLVAVDDVAAAISPIFPTFGVQVLRTSSSSATTQELADIRFSSFNGGVTVDTTSPNTGTEFPNGTPRQPVNNIMDAVSIANSIGLSIIYIVGDCVLDSGDNVDSFIVRGQSPNHTTLTINPGASTIDTQFENATITGTLDGGSVLNVCHIQTLNFIDGFIHDSQFDGTITLSGVSDLHAINCHSGIIGTGTPTIDMTAGGGLAMRHYTGGIKLINKSGPESVSLDINTGQVQLDSTVTNGEIVIRGNAFLTDNSNGATVIYQGLTPGSIADAVLDEPADDHLQDGSVGKRLDRTEKSAGLIVPFS